MASGGFPLVNAGRISATPFAQRNGKAELNASGIVRSCPDRFCVHRQSRPRGTVRTGTQSRWRATGTLQAAPAVGLASGELSDAEGLARIDVDGGITLIVSSSLAIRKKRVGHDGLLRVRYARDGDLPAEAMPGFRDWLVQQYPDLAAAANLDVDDGGLEHRGRDVGSGAGHPAVRRPVPSDR